jgi:cytochrome c peroxidase
MRAVLLALLAATPACRSAATVPELTENRAPAGYPDGPVTAAAPADSPLTEARAKLGRRLFYDSRLSRTGAVACASCHRQEHAFGDLAPVSRGVDGRTGTRNAPALVNRAWSSSLFWDGRAPSLEEVAGQPFENPLEMDLPLADAVEFVGRDAGYVREFATAFGGALPSAETLRQALASFVRTLVSGTSPYDRHLRGNDSDFGPAARRGEALFFGRAGCFRCHPGGPFTNGGYFNNGTYVAGGDPGRQMVTGRTGDLGKFKVPTLRNVAVSAPYMHDGSLATLHDVVDQYARGGRGDPSVDPLIKALALSDDDKGDLIAFLGSLTDIDFLTDIRFKP